jgi:acylphosphatase
MLLGGKEMTLFAKVIGKVQGVYFRAYTQEVARKLGLTGRVRNLPDGSVEVIAVGNEETIDELIRLLKRGSPGSNVTNVEIKKEKSDLAFDDFRIVY